MVKNLPRIFIADIENMSFSKLLNKSNFRFRKFRYPSYAKDDKTSEDYFNEWFTVNYPLKTDYINKADLIYIPINWTKVALREGVDEANLIFDKVLGQYSAKAIKIFTVIQHDDADIIARNYLKHPDLILACASRKADLANAIDIPLVTTPISTIDPSIINLSNDKKYKACFIGRTTHPCRTELIKLLSEHMPLSNNIRIIESSNISSKDYFSCLAQSLYALCPRGYGGSSFRFFEALQLKCIPIHIGDIDTRPFFTTHPNRYSHYFREVSHDIINLINSPEYNLSHQATIGLNVYAEELRLNSWPRQLLLKLCEFLN